MDIINFTQKHIGKMGNTCIPWKGDIFTKTTYPVYRISPEFMKSLPGIIYMSQVPKAVDIQNFKKEYNISHICTLLQPHEIYRFNLTNYLELCEKSGINLILFPIKDEMIPENKEKFNEIIEILLSEITAGKNILIHCKHGKGRTGLMAAAILIKMGYSKDEALEILKKSKPTKSAQHKIQQNFLDEYEKLCRLVLKC